MKIDVVWENMATCLKNEGSTTVRLVVMIWELPGHGMRGAMADPDVLL